MDSKVAQTFAALADPTRCAVIDLLRHAPLRSGQMASLLSTTRPMMSRHLRVLRAAGLVEEESPEDDARARVYRLCREPFVDMRSWLDEVEAFWDEQLLAFKSHAERSQRKREP